MTLLIMLGLLSWFAFALYFGVYIYSNHDQDYTDKVLNKYRKEYERD
jgi:hypothetical protein